MNHPLTLVTGASSNHFVPLQNLLWTVSRFHPACRVIVYDLGLGADERSYLLDTPPFFLPSWEFRTFDFGKYPPHFAMGPDAGRMAFRPTTLASAAHEFGGIVAWMDAGCQIRRRLDALIVQVTQRSYYVERTAKTVGEKLYPSARVPLAVTDELLKQCLRDAGICAFDTSRPDVLALLDKWAGVALDAAITAPTGSTRWTHRQDAVFTVLFNQAATANKWDVTAPRVEGLRFRCDWMTFAETRFHTNAH